MFKVSRVSRDRLDITMSGKLNSEEMKEALDELVNKSKDIHDGKLLYDVVDFHLPSLNAIAIEFSRFPAMFGWIRKFKRAAVLTDKTWIKKISELEGALVPGIEIKGFERDQKDEAETWLES
ncbi:MAG: STAS/SEC14 domain-containing protein [Acidiferrobacterales bacterium]